MLFYEFKEFQLCWFSKFLTKLGFTGFKWLWQDGVNRSQNTTTVQEPTNYGNLFVLGTITGCLCCRIPNLNLGGFKGLKKVLKAILDVLLGHSKVKKISFK